MDKKTPSINSLLERIKELETANTSLQTEIAQYKSVSPDTTNSNSEIIGSNENYGLALIDSEFNFLKINKFFSKLLNYQASSLINESSSLIFSESEFNRFRRYLISVGQKETLKSSIEIMVLNSSGVEKNTTLFATAISTGDSADFVYQITIIDVNEKVNNLEKLRQEVAILKEAQLIAHTGYWTYNVKNKKAYWSPELQRLIEIDLDAEITSDKAFDHVHPADKDMVKKAISRCIDRNIMIDMVYRTQHKDGSIKYISLKTMFEYTRKGKIENIVGIVHDVTDRYIHEKALKESENLYRNIFEQTTDMFIILEIVENQEGDITDYIVRSVNKTYEHRLGIEQKNIFGYYLSEKNQELFQQLSGQLNLTAITDEPQLDRIFINSLDSFFDILIYAPIEKHLAIVFRDVNLMVESENSIKNSEAKYRQLFSLSKDGIIFSDLKTKEIIDVNPTISDMYGYTRKELIGMPMNELIANQTFINNQINDQVKSLINTTSIKKDGEHFQAELKLSFFNWAGKRVFITSVRDITSRLNAQQILVENEKKYRQIFEYSGDAVLMIENHKIVQINRKASLLFKFDIEQIKNQPIWQISPKRQEDGQDSRQSIIEKIQSVLMGEQIRTRWIFQKSNNSSFIGEMQMSPVVFNEGKYVQIVVRDITEVVNKEKAALFIEKRWQYALEGSKHGVWDWNLETNEMFISEAFKSMLGYSADEIDNHFDSLEKLTHKDDISKLYDAIDKFVKSNLSENNVEFRMRSKNGHYKWFSGKGSTVAMNNNGKPIRFIGTFEDITKNKLEATKSVSTENKLKFATEAAKIGYWDLDLRSMALTGSKQTFKILGIKDITSVSLRAIEKMVHPEDRENFLHIFTENTKTSEQKVEFRILIENTIKHIQSYNFPNITKGVLESVSGIFQDITFYKQQEVLLRENEEFYRGMAESNIMAIHIVQNDSLAYYNPRFAQLTGYKSKQELNSKFDLYSLYDSDFKDLIRNTNKNILDGTNTSNHSEIAIINRYKRKLYIETFSSNLSYKGQPSVLSVWMDITKRKKSEIEITQSEELHKSICNNSPVGAAMLKSSGIITYANPSFLNATGKAESEIVNKLFYETLPKETHGDLFEKFNSIESKKINGFSQDVLIENNQLIKTWFRLNLHAIKKEDGSFDNAILTLFNINKQKETEITLKDSEYRYKMLFDSADEGISMCDFNGNILYANKKFYNIINLERNSNKFYSLKNTLFKDQQYRLFQLIESVKQNQSFNDELLIEGHEKNNEKHLSIQSALLTTQSNNPYGILLIINDITDKKKDEENLRKSEERFRTMFDSAPLACMLIDKNRSIKIANNRVLTIFNISNKELKERRIDHLTHTDSLEKLIQNFSELFAGLKDNVSLEVKYQTPEGKTIFTNNTVAALKNNLGETEHAFLMINDITDKKEIEKKVLQSEKINALGQLAEGIAHDYNNQLMGIHGNAFLLKNKLRDQKNLSDYAENILIAVNRSSDITQKLMAFSTKGKLIEIPINMHNLIQDSIQLIKPQKLEHIEIKQNYLASNSILMGDPAKIQNALINIMLNGIDAMNETGQLTIDTELVYFERRQSDNHRLKMLAPGQYLKIQIKDTGKGMNDKIIQNIFDPFFTTKSNKKATGLGLPAALGIIQSHKGTIIASSTPNQGSKFSIYLPSSSTDYYQFDSPDEQVVIKGMANILFIDDEEIVRTITVELLKELGYNVYAFSKGSSAIQFFNKNKDNIDLVLLDLIMPEMDGNAVFERIIRVKPDVKVLILSGYGHNNEVDELLKMGVAGFIKKPAGMAELSQKIAEILKGVIEPEENKFSEIDTNNALDMLGGNEKLFKKIMNQFVEKYEGILPEIQDNLNNKEFDKAKLIVHSIKSIAGNLGATDLNKISQKLEDLIISRNEEGLKFQFIIFKEVFRFTIERIKDNELYEEKTK